MKRKLKKCPKVGIGVRAWKKLFPWAKKWEAVPEGYARPQFTWQIHFMMKNKYHWNDRTCRLAHGFSNTHFQLAWLEINGRAKIADTNNKVIIDMSIQDFYQKFGIAPGMSVQFDMGETSYWMQRYRHYGPWEEAFNEEA